MVRGVQASDGLLWWAYEVGFLHGSGEQVWKPVSFLLVPLAFGIRFFRVLRGSLALHGLPCVYLAVWFSAASREGLCVPLSVPVEEAFLPFLRLLARIGSI